MIELLQTICLAFWWTNLRIRWKRLYWSFLLIPSSDYLNANVSNKPLSLLDVQQKLWIPDIKQGDTQTNSSFSEQGEVIDAILHDLSAFIDADNSFVSKAHLRMGKPGSGKSHASSICLLFALSKDGHCAFATNLSARRASGFNCEHNSSVTLYRREFVYWCSNCCWTSFEETWIQARAENTTVISGCSRERGNWTYQCGIVSYHGLDDAMPEKEHLFLWWFVCYC